MREAYVVEALRTPFGSFGGALSGIEAPLLASEIIKELLKRTNIAGDDVDEIIMGNTSYGFTSSYINCTNENNNQGHPNLCYTEASQRELPQTWHFCSGEAV